MAAVIPLLWALIGTSAAILLNVREDLGLGISAVILVVQLVVSSRHVPRSAIPG